MEQMKQEVIHFFQDKNQKVVGRANNGKIAIISYRYKGKWVNAGESWLCDVIIEPKRLLVFPVERMRTADQNFSDTVKKLDEYAGELKTPKISNVRIYHKK